MEVELKYKELGGFEFTQIVQKIANTPMHNTKAVALRKTIKTIQAAREKMALDYKAEVMAAFGEKNADGTLKVPDGEPNNFIPMEGKEEELMKANDAFGERTTKLDIRPFTPSLLLDVKLSPKELDILGVTFSEEEGPGLPNMAPPMAMPKQLSN